MKKTILVAASLAFSSAMTFAQVFAEKKYEVGNPREAPKCFGQGVMTLTAGYGYPSWGQVIFNLVIPKDTMIKWGYEDYATKGLGPLHFRGEIGLSKFIGMGISMNYETYGGKWTKLYYNQTQQKDQFYAESITAISLSVMPRLNLHFAVTNQLDPYMGIGAGYKLTTYKFHSDFPNATNNNVQEEGPLPVGFETTVGVRFYFSDSFGMYMEMGWAKSLVQGGLSIKL